MILSKPKVGNQSAYRHIHHATLKKDFSFTHASIENTGNRVLQSSDSFMAFPFKTGGGVLVVQRHDGGKNLTKVKKILVSNTKINTFEFSPFVENVIATGCDDGLIKIWDVPMEGLTANMDQSVQTIDVGSRVHFLKYHPHVAGLMCSFSRGNSKIWDIENGSEVVSFESPKSFHYAEWTYDGMLLTSSLDKKLKMFDPRSGSLPVKEYDAHTSVKPIEIAILGNSSTDSGIPDENLIGTIGWGAQSNREIAIWDLRQNDFLSKTALDKSSSWILPFYDPATGILLLAEKGTTIYSYEITAESPHAWLLNKHTLNLSNRQGVCSVPKRAMDTSKTEVQRLLVASNTTIETISFTQPRKNKEIFHEDLYAFTPASAPSSTFEQWQTGLINDPIYHVYPDSLTLPSIYDVPIEEGGKSRVVERTKRELGNINTKNLELLLEVAAEINTDGEWIPVHCTIKGNSLYAFDNPTSTAHKKSWNIGQFTSINRLEEKEISISLKQSEFFIRLENSHFRESWILSLKQYKEKSSIISGILEFGDCEVLLLGNWVPTENVLLDNSVLSISHEEEIAIHIDKVVSVHEIRGGIDTHYYCVRILSTEGITILSFKSEDDSINFVERLEEQRFTGKLESDSLLSFEGSATVNGEENYIIAGGAYIFLCESQSSPIHSSYIRLADVKSIERDGDIITVAYYTDKESTTFLFAQDIEKWISVLIELNIQSMAYVNILDSFGITQNELPIEERTRDLESRLFGNIDPVFNKNGENPLLLKISGRRRLRVSLLPMDVNLLHSGAVFILDIGHTLFEWRGTKSTTIQKAKSLDIMQRIRMNERGGAPKLVKLKQTVKDDNDIFWSYFGGYQEITNFVDPQTEDIESTSVVMYRVLEREVNLIHDTGLPSVKKLKANGVYIIQYAGEFYIWFGKDSSQRQRKLGLKIMKILQERCNETPMVWSKIVDRAELVIFKEKFYDFPDNTPIQLTQKKVKSNVAQKRVYHINFENLYYSEREEEYYDAGVGDIIGFKVDEAGRHLLKKSHFGQFGGKEGYLFEYYYKHKNTESIWGLLFNWQGRVIDNSVKVANAFLMKNCMAEMNDAAIVKQIPAHQFAEPDQFLKIIQKQFGCVIYHKDKFDHTWYKGKKIFKIVSLDSLKTFAEEVEFDVKILHSGHSYVIADYSNDNTFIVWHGSKSPPRIREYAVTVVNFIKKYIRKTENEETDNMILIEELALVLPRDEETDDLSYDDQPIVITEIGFGLSSDDDASFDYESSRDSEMFDSVDSSVISSDEIDEQLINLNLTVLEEIDEAPLFWNYFGMEQRDPELYWTDSGYIKIFELNLNSGSPNLTKIYEIDQTLTFKDVSNCFILDMQNAIWIWFPVFASFENRKGAMEMAIKYRDSLDEVSDDIPILITHEYQEPLAFTQAFPYWDYNSKYIPRKYLNLEKVTNTLEELSGHYFKEIYSIEEIVAVDPSELPEGVDSTKLEIYLTDEDFETVTEMTRKQFLLLPAWKQKNVKIETKLLFKKETNAVGYLFGSHQN